MDSFFLLSIYSMWMFRIKARVTWSSGETWNKLELFCLLGWYHYNLCYGLFGIPYTEQTITQGKEWYQTKKQNSNLFQVSPLFQVILDHIMTGLGFDYFILLCWYSWTVPCHKCFIAHIRNLEKAIWFVLCGSVTSIDQILPHHLRSLSQLIYNEIYRYQ